MLYRHAHTMLYDNVIADAGNGAKQVLDGGASEAKSAAGSGSRLLHAVQLHRNRFH